VIFQPTLEYGSLDGVEDLVCWVRSANADVALPNDCDVPHSVNALDELLDKRMLPSSRAYAREGPVLSGEGFQSRC
jgi:hypothetical protein